VGVLQRRLRSTEISCFEMDSGRSRKLLLFEFHILDNWSAIRERV
jgi:hypothetical protein